MISSLVDSDRALETHPCYNEAAHRKFARMHIPVAPKCNIQCNYCNRKYDCSNESRPGVTSDVLSPTDALNKIRFVKDKIPELTVIGIAGPGDPLANDSTFEVLKGISEEFPELTACISTNGLVLPENAHRLKDLGVNFVTVTMNAIDPETGSKIYDHIFLNGKRYNGIEGARILLDRQLKGIELCSKLGMKVKVNTVMIPEINDSEIPQLARKVRSLGAFMVNILPLIPVEGTAFSDMRAPTPEERKRLIDKCGIDVKMMRHCKQCRADAVGLLDEDRSSEFVNFGSCGSGCGGPMMVKLTNESCSNKGLIAIASSDGVIVDGGFGNTGRFLIYDGKNKDPIRIEIIDTSSNVVGKPHREHLESIVNAIDDCDTVVVKEIGDLPTRILDGRKKRVIVSSGKIADILSEINRRY